MSYDSIELTDTSWMAVQESDLDFIIATLRLQPLKHCSYFDCEDTIRATGVANHRDWPNLDHVFVSIQLNGWRLLVGDYFGAAPDHKDPDDQRPSYKATVEYCKKLSRNKQVACAFTDQPCIDWYSWIRAENARIMRQVVYEDGIFVSQTGSPCKLEHKLIAEFALECPAEPWAPDVENVARIAKAWSFDPNRTIRRLRTGWLCSTQRSAIAT